jgi:hypothetical protein
MRPHSHIRTQPRYSSIILHTHILYPITSILPIGDEYEEFPFILFRSFNLQEQHMLNLRSILSLAEINQGSIHLAYATWGHLFLHEDQNQEQLQKLLSYHLEKYK